MTLAQQFDLCRQLEELQKAHGKLMSDYQELLKKYNALSGYIVDDRYSK